VIDQLAVPRLLLSDSDRSEEANLIPDIIEGDIVGKAVQKGLHLLLVGHEGTVTTICDEFKVRDQVLGD
jgi:hypothetical protein